jgi:site-specific recombinase XerD
MRSNQLGWTMVAPAGQRVPTVHGGLEEWLLDRQAFRNVSVRTIAWYRERTRYLLEITGPEMPVTEISLEHVRRMLADGRARGNVDETVHGLFRATKAFVRWCLRQGWPMDQRLIWMEAPIVGAEDEVEIFTPADVAALQKHWNADLRNLLMLNLLLGTGIRLSELVGLRLEDRHQDQIEVRWETAKGRKTRWPPLSSRLQRDWIRYVERVRPPVAGEPQLLLRADGKRLTKWGVENAFQKLGAAVRVHANPHKFRHTFATWFIRRHIEEGIPWDPERLRLIMGHKSYRLFPRYVHLAKSDLVMGWDRVAPY